MSNFSILSDNDGLDFQDQILSDRSISAISGNISGESFNFGNNTIYSNNDDVISTMVFNISDIDRLIDIEKELKHYEAKYIMSSSDFYARWKSEDRFDETDFNKWADLYQTLQYVQK